MIEKPHRFLIDRVSSYGEEGMAYLRRRKLRSLPFVRIRLEGGEEVAVEASDPRGEELFAVAGELIEAERES
ncbi:MAG: hypothetical protein R2718_02135 [Solirubrobacterales bacterium]|nr:hypothetical protein [Solirubrobacterales bacterium]